MPFNTQIANLTGIWKEIHKVSMHIQKLTFTKTWTNGTMKTSAKVYMTLGIKINTDVGWYMVSLGHSRNWWFHLSISMLKVCYQENRVYKILAISRKFGQGDRPINTSIKAASIKKCREENKSEDQFFLLSTTNHELRRQVIIRNNRDSI